MGALVLEDGHVLDVYSVGGQGIVELSLSLVHADRWGLDANSTTSCIRKSVGGMEQGIVASEWTISTRWLGGPSFIANRVLLPDFGFLDMSRSVSALLDIAVSGNLVLVDWTLHKLSVRVRLVLVNCDLLSLEDDRLLANYLGFLRSVAYMGELRCLIARELLLCPSLILDSVDGLGGAHRVGIMKNVSRITTFIVDFPRLVEPRLLIEGHHCFFISFLIGPQIFGSLNSTIITY